MGIMKYLIIGGGPAGLSAAATLRRIDDNGLVTILTKERILPYARIALPYLINGAVDEELLFLPMPSGANIALGEEVSEINPDNQEVKTSSGKTFAYDKLLLASGAAPLKPKIEGIGLPFVFTIRDMLDVHRIQDILKEKKTGRAVVAGAGPVGLELSDALEKLGYAITLVISSDRIFSTMLDSPASALLEKRLAEKNVEVRKNEDVAGVLPSGEVILSSGESRQCDVVIFGKGVASDIGFLAGSGIDAHHGILVDDRQQTNIPGIYAAGDAAETRDLVYEDSRVNALWPEALQQGKVAAYNMASRPLAYEGSYSRNAMRVFDTSIYVAGMAKADGFEVCRNEGPDFYHKLVLDKGVLNGFIFLGEARNIGLYNDLLRRRLQVAFFADSILNGSLDYAQIMRKITRQ
jgi:NADPH-dependent 2,4-dienoyl-CoA reductase/sulfur reductase-like enzyme